VKSTLNMSDKEKERWRDTLLTRGSGDGNWKAKPNPEKNLAKPLSYRVSGVAKCLTETHLKTALPTPGLKTKNQKG